MTSSKHQHAGGVFDRPLQLLCVTAVLLALSWIAFVGSLHLHEMIVGVVVVGLSTAFCRLVYRSEKIAFDFRLRDVAQCWRIPWYIAARCAQITWLLVKDLLGDRVGSFYRVCGFRGGTRDPIAVGRSALAIAFSTAAPNFIVIGIDPHQNHMLFHQIERSDLSKMTQELGAQS
ncbi:MAG: hypothetical protein ACRYFU_07340 [Janthinobacterium lividum]